MLQSAGSFYDEARGFKKFNTNGAEWKETLKMFSNACCYCGTPLNDNNETNDHLIPINKTSLGLHAWGNVVPCCQLCNKEKHFGDWEQFIKRKSKGGFYKKRVDLIRAFQKKFRYDPSLRLKDIANNLYEDVGEVSSVLISLRLKQAQGVIQSLLGGPRHKIIRKADSKS